MRPLRRAAALWCALALVGTLAACQGPSAPAAPAAREADPAALAREAFDRRDWAAAAPSLRTAITRDAGNGELHYKLAIAASYLALVDEAAREFEWVVAHAREGSEEVRVARQWLAAAADQLAGSRRVSAAGDSVDAAPGDRGGESGISGVVTWAEIGSTPEPKRRMQVHLVAIAGQQTVDEQRFTVRTDQDGRYAFTKIPAGTYKVTNAVAGTPLWRLRVKIEPGRDMALDLNNANSITSRDDFPDKG